VDREFFFVHIASTTAAFVGDDVHLLMLEKSSRDGEKCVRVGLGSVTDGEWS